MLAGAIRAGKAFVELLADDSKLRRQLAKVQVRMQKWGRSLQQMGSSLFTGGLAAATPLALGARIFANYSDQISLVRAVAKGTKDELDQLDRTAKKLGATTSFTASQVAELMVELGRGGMTAKEINTATQGVLDLARATGTETGTTAGIVVAALRAFNLEASQSQRVADVLTAAANGSFNTLQTLGEAFTYAGVSAAQAGMSIEETAAILMALGNVDIQGSMAGTTLRRLLTINAAEAQKLQEIFGVTFRDAAGNARPLVDVFEEINAAMEGLGSGERAAAFNEAFGLLGITGAQVIAGSTLDVRQFTEELQRAGGTARKVAGEMDDNLGGSFRMMMSAVEGLAIAVAEALTPTFREWARTIETNAGVWAAWVQANASAIISAAKLTAGVLALGAALKALGTIMTFVGKHPLIAVLGLGAAAFQYWTSSAERASDAAADFSRKQREALAAGDERRSQLTQMMDRLRELAAKQQLTNSEQDEARKIVNQLNSAYGDLGITIDKTTGKIEGLTAATRKQIEADLESRVNQLRQAEVAKRSEAKVLMDQAGAVHGDTWSRVAAEWWERAKTMGFGAGSWSSQVKSVDDAAINVEQAAWARAAKVQGEAAAIAKELQETTEKLNRVRRGEIEAVKEQAEATGEAAAAQRELVTLTKEQRVALAEQNAELDRLEAQTKLRGEALDKRLLEIDRRRDMEVAMASGDPGQVAFAEQRGFLQQMLLSQEHSRSRDLRRLERDAELQRLAAENSFTGQQLERRLLEIRQQLEEERAKLEGDDDELGFLREKHFLERLQLVQRRALEKLGESRVTFSGTAAARGALSAGGPVREILARLDQLIRGNDQVARAVEENAPKAIA